MFHLRAAWYSCSSVQSGNARPSCHAMRLCSRRNSVCTCPERDITHQPQSSSRHSPTHTQPNACRPCLGTEAR